ncbi:ATP/GTP-binding protein [Brachybacterium alimentarium]|uniref:ATP/GTP-binding protein n=1 Tax=Brachybacterium alimentarium TaxID=47845 RepID=A0A2A3YHN9_9MICO|nr:TniB family NTP-binding protein [Brachybacterium alimentarium]PCC38830.1 ATP/GTP-binding protein [Brachybacterium alimentarium]
MTTNPWAAWIRAHGTDRSGIHTKDDWMELAHSKPRPRPPTPADPRTLGVEEVEDYEETRRIWNANPATIKTPQLAGAFALMDQVMASNYRDAGQLRGSVVLDAEPALGKTTIAVQYARGFHSRTIRRYGERTRDGHQRIPVAYLSLSAATTLKGLNQKLLRFYGHPAAARHTRSSLASLAVDCVRSCHTQLIVIDDLHFVDFAHRDGRAVSDHLKSLANEMSATFIYVGVQLRQRRFFDEGSLPHGGSTAQTARRATRCEIQPFQLDTGTAARAWRKVLATYEDHLMLHRKRPGMLADHADLLFERTQGYIGSLTNLIDRAAYLAIITGVEDITDEILDEVVIDNAAESQHHAAAR